MASEKTPVVWDDDAKKHRPLGSGEKMGGLSASSMISSDSGNLLQQGSDGLMLVTGSSLADPRADNLLEESANGKLQVTSDRVVEWLEGHPQAAAALAEAVKVVSEDSGNVIAAGTDKGAFLSKDAISGAVSTMSAAQLSTLANALRKQGGGLSVGSDGKLSVDFGSMDPAIMRNVVLSMVQQGGGIAVDQSGKLYVDFDNMPTDKFEALLKSLKMQIPLEANLNLYVNNLSDGDSLVDGRGTQEKPFKTLQACVTYATQNFALGRYNIYINVAKGSGVYSETVVCPIYTSSSGKFVVQAADYSDPPIFVNAGIISTPISVTGGYWIFRRINFSCNFSSPNDGYAHHPVVFHAGGNTATAEVSGCAFSCSYAGSAPSSGSVKVRVISITGGASGYFPVLTGYHNSFDFSIGQANSLEVFLVENSASVTMPDGNVDNPDSYTIPCSGSCSTFITVAIDSVFYHVGGGRFQQQFSGASVTGRPYSVSGGSGIVAPTGGFPGDGTPVVEDSTYSWYK